MYVCCQATSWATFLGELDDRINKSKRWGGAGRGGSTTCVQQLAAGVCSSAELSSWNQISAHMVWAHYQRPACAFLPPAHTLGSVKVTCVTSGVTRCNLEDLFRAVDALPSLEQQVRQAPGALLTRLTPR